MNYLYAVKLTLQIKLLPDNKQMQSLKDTLKECNTACNEIAKRCFEKKIWGQYKIHHEVYYSVKSSFNLSSQMVVRCISKVADSYKLDKKVQRTFKPLGGIAYDSRVLTYKKDSVSIWCIGGRQTIKFVCHNPNYIPYIKGEADLVLKKGKFYLFQTVEVPEEDVKDVESFIGCDFGQTDIVTLSDGTNFNSEQLKKIRKKYSKVRASVQSKGTKGSKKLLKRLSGRERRFVAISNHTISKQIVAKAKTENKGIAIEDLSKIRFTAKPKSKAQKTELNRWSFYQLRQFLTYKGLLNGVKVVVIPPAYTSQTCSVCLHIGKRVAKYFTCENCGNVSDADHNAAKNISAWGNVVNLPERESMLYCTVHHLISKAPIPLG
jgi:putative transposase